MKESEDADQQKPSLPREEPEPLMASRISPSATDAELLPLALLLGESARPLTNIVVAPHEIGSGSVQSTKGLHSSDITAGGIGVKTGLYVLIDFQLFYPLAGFRRKIECDLEITLKD